MGHQDRDAPLVLADPRRLGVWGDCQCGPSLWISEALRRPGCWAHVRRVSCHTRFWGLQRGSGQEALAAVAKKAVRGGSIKAATGRAASLEAIDQERLVGRQSDNRAVGAAESFCLPSWGGVRAGLLTLGRVGHC